MNVNCFSKVPVTGKLSSWMLLRRLLKFVLFWLLMVLRVSDPDSEIATLFSSVERCCKTDGVLGAQHRQSACIVRIQTLCWAVYIMPSSEPCLSVYRQFFVISVMIIYLIMSHTWIIIVNRFTVGETYSSALRCVCAISQISRRSVQHKYPCFPAVVLSSSLFSVPLKGWNFSVDESAMGAIAAEPPNNMSGPLKDLYVVKLTPTIKGQGTSAPKIFTPVISMLQLKLLNLAVTTDVYIYSSGYRTGHGC